MTVQFALKLVFLGRSTELKLWSIRGETRKLIKLGFSLCEINSKLDFSEKRQGFDCKSQTETHSEESYCTTNKLIFKVRCTEKNALVSRVLLLFWSYRPKLLQCFLENTSAVNISSQDHFFITGMGKNLRVVATSLLGNFGYRTNRKKDLRQKQNCSGTACLRWHHPADINWDAVITVARQVQIQTDRKKDLCPKPNDSAYNPRAFRPGPLPTVPAQHEYWAGSLQTAMPTSLPGEVWGPCNGACSIGKWTWFYQ